jgi:hypothetical protein
VTGEVAHAESRRHRSNAFVGALVEHPDVDRPVVANPGHRLERPAQHPDRFTVGDHGGEQRDPLVWFGGHRNRVRRHQGEPGERQGLRCAGHLHTDEQAGQAGHDQVAPQGAAEAGGDEADHHHGTRGQPGPGDPDERPPLTYRGHRLHANRDSGSTVGPQVRGQTRSPVTRCADHRCADHSHGRPTLGTAAL